MVIWGWDDQLERDLFDVAIAGDGAMPKGSQVVGNGFVDGFEGTLDIAPRYATFANRDGE